MNEVLEAVILLAAVLASISIAYAAAVGVLTPAKMPEPKKVFGGIYTSALMVRLVTISIDQGIFQTELHLIMLNYRYKPITVYISIICDGSVVMTDNMTIVPGKMFKIYPLDIGLQDCYAKIVEDSGAAYAVSQQTTMIIS
jgi:hypothetical protein